MENKLTAVLLIALVYAIIYTASSGIDREFCEGNGLDYLGTSLDLVGYCDADGIKVKALDVWNKSNGINESVEGVNNLGK